MRNLVFAIALTLGVPLADAAPSIAIHATCAVELAHDPAHVRTLRGELTHALAGTRGTRGYKLDVSLVRLGTFTRGGELEVRAEVRAMLSDESGRVRWSSLSRATARGTPRDHLLLQRDAVTSAARELAKQVRAHCCTMTASR